MYVNCGSRNARCSFSKVQIISLVFKWLIVLRSAIKTRHQMHRVLKNAFVASQDAYKTHVYSSAQAVLFITVVFVAGVVVILRCSDHCHHRYLYRCHCWCRLVIIIIITVAAAAPIFVVVVV